MKIANMLKHYSFDTVTPPAYLLAEKNQRLSRMPEVAPLMANIPSLLATLKQLAIPFGIASNSPTAYLLRTLTHHNLKVEFAFGIEYARRPKPDPSPFLNCLQAVSRAPANRTLVCEDSAHGITAATKAGMLAIGIANTTERMDSLSRAGARKILSQTGDLVHQSWFKDIEQLRADQTSFK